MTPEEISALFGRWREADARRDSVALANIYGASAPFEILTPVRRTSSSFMHSQSAPNRVTI
jgi:hypothetical protein